MFEIVMFLKSKLGVLISLVSCLVIVSVIVVTVELAFLIITGVIVSVMMVVTV